MGDCSRIAAGSVVLKDVPPRTTVAGVPARVVGEAGCGQPSRMMDQLLKDLELNKPETRSERQTNHDARRDQKPRTIFEKNLRV